MPLQYYKYALLIVKSIKMPGESQSSSSVVGQWVSDKEEIIFFCPGSFMYSKVQLSMLNAFLDRRRYMSRRSWGDYGKDERTWDHKTYKCHHTSSYVTQDNLTPLSHNFCHLQNNNASTFDRIQNKASQIFVVAE